MNDSVEKLKNKIVVSVQAQDNEPLNRVEHLLAISQSVIGGGAGGLRLCGVENIKYIKKHVSLPIIGLTKLGPTPINWLERVYITATIKDVKELIKTKVEFISIDGTSRTRADNSKLKDQIALIKGEGRIVVADVSTFEEGVNSAELGADLVSTTLSGYTKDTRHKINEGPDFDLLSSLVEELGVPVILEGRVWEVADVQKAFEIGAFAVVIGTAITRPHLITKRFVASAPQD